jgi:hypothetical protein
MAMAMAMATYAHRHAEVGLRECGDVALAL